MTPEDELAGYLQSIPRIKQVCEVLLLRDQLPHYRKKSIEAAAVALDPRGELVAQRDLHAGTGDGDVSDPVFAGRAALDQMPLELHPAAARQNFAADDGLAA